MTRAAFGLALYTHETHDWTFNIASNEYGLRETESGISFGDGPYEKSYHTEIVFADHEFAMHAKMWVCLAVAGVCALIVTFLAFMIGRGRRQQSAAPLPPAPQSGPSEGAR